MVTDMDHGTQCLVQSQFHHLLTVDSGQVS